MSLASRTRFSHPFVAVVVAALSSACGGDAGISFTPASPSGLGSASSSGAVIAGRVNSPVAAATSDRPAGWSTSGFSTMASTSITVTIVGTNVSTVVDGGGQFTLSGVPPGDVRLRFSGSGIDATLTLAGVTASDRIEITVTLNGNSARLNSERRSSSSNGVLVNGPITSINLAGRSFQADGHTVNVPATAVIRHGGRTLRFADLRVGNHVIVKGTREGTTVTATEVKVNEDEDEDDDEDDEDDEDDDRSGRLEQVSGRVTGLSGVCPAIVLTLNGTSVRTDVRTEFKDACTRIVIGSRVEVRGIREATGLLATRVEVDD